MRISGPPRYSLALFGGPGFILTLLALLGLGAGALYLAGSGKRSTSGGASLSLPGDLGQARPAPSGLDAGGESTALQPLQPMAANGTLSPAPAAAPVRPKIIEDLSPIDLLVRYTPDPHLALAEAAAAASGA